MYDKNDRTKLMLLPMVLLAFLFTGCQLEDADSDGFPEVMSRSTELPSDAQRETVERVVDGDTLHLRNFGSSRLIGIDTPETYEGPECYGREASDYLKNLLRPGDEVLVARDQEARDRYGRLLVYLWMPDGRMVNELILENGFATPLSIRPNTHFSSIFEGVASQARETNAGLWSACEA